MTPEEFKEKWQAAAGNERQFSQTHFLDLCRMLGVQNPTEADPSGTVYTFEKNTLKLGGSSGRADVWKRGCFAWEYKKDKTSLAKAYAQLKQYADGLENPPLLIVSDMKDIHIHTNFNTEVAEEIVIPLPDIISVEARRKLYWAFTDPEKLKPGKTREQVTAEAAARFGAIAEKLMRTFDRRRVAHFLNRLVFCLFAQDIDLLPERVFAEILEVAVKQKSEPMFEGMLRDLFRAMKDRNGRFGDIAIPWFNGGLFDDDDVLPLHGLDIQDLAQAARLDWSAIRPSIFGTLFEQGLDENKRKQMASLFDPSTPAPSPGRPGGKGGGEKGVGIHYTDEATIMKIIEPVVLRPLRREWEQVKAGMAAEDARAEAADGDGVRARHRAKRGDLYLAFRDRLGRFQVLDPACGSGNFLYLSLLHLKDFDLAVLDEAKALGLPADDQRVTPQAVLGIEINGYAAELARVTIWIGELQWQLRNAFGIRRTPILDSLPGIECRDALLNEGGSEAEWPAADAIVGNPPFLGGKKLIGGLGEPYVGRLFRAFDGRVPAEADLVCYWVYKAGSKLSERPGARAGLVTTNSIRGGANRKVLDGLPGGLAIYEAWDDEPWVLDGAAVRVSLISIAALEAGEQIRLNGRTVSAIHSDLTARTGVAGTDTTLARRLPENAGVSFMGDTKGGAFDVPGDIARAWLAQPLNPNGRPNADVLRPWVNGFDITRRPTGKWIIDFGSMSEEDAGLYENPFAHIFHSVKEQRLSTREPRGKTWWQHIRPRTEMRTAILNFGRFIVTPTIAKHRVFFWISRSVIPDHQLIVMARDDDTTFGILHSRVHKLWSLRLCTWLGVGNDPRYTPTTTFETFPFPEGLTPNIPAADYADDRRAIQIAEAARRLNELRENWLNPADLVRREPEVVPGYPDRILPVSDRAAVELKKRTLTNLYNLRPAWLANAHRDLDEAVAAAYGWPADLSDDEILKRLLDLNLARSATS